MSRGAGVVSEVGGVVEFVSQGAGLVSVGWVLRWRAGVVNSGLGL